jgi:FlgD Ig-like domain
VTSPKPEVGRGDLRRILSLRRVAITALVVGLLVGTTVAFAVTQALKLERSPIKRPRFSQAFSPTCDCPQASARLTFLLRRADSLDIDVVDGDGEEVRRLEDGARHPVGTVALRWDGRDGQGEVVPDGIYRLRIHLEDDRRTIVIPNRIRVDTKAPRIQIVSLEPHLISPDGDGVRDFVTIRARVSERALPLVLIDGALADRGRWTDRGGTSFRWPGTVRGDTLPAGRYQLALRARDAAGNVSAPTVSTLVRIRLARTHR